MGVVFQHLAIILNDIWFEESYINKLAAFDEEFLKGDWSMLDDYRNFLNQHTAWIRHFSPDKVFNWQQRIEVKEQGKKLYKGNKSILKGLNLKLSPSKGVVVRITNSIMRKQVLPKPWLLPLDI